MRRMLLLFVCAACAPACRASLPAAAALQPLVPEKTVCWPVVPLRLEALDHKTDWKPQAVLDADGSIHNPQGPAFGRIVADDAETSGDALRCDPYKTVHLNSKAAFHYDDADALVSEKGAERWIRIFIADDGEVEVNNGGILVGPTAERRARVVGDVRRARRTAALLVLLSLDALVH
jgi:hypothetical protein